MRLNKPLQNFILKKPHRYQVYVDNALVLTYHRSKLRVTSCGKTIHILSFLHAIVETALAQIKPIIIHLCYEYLESYVCLVLDMSLGRQRCARMTNSTEFPQSWKLRHTLIDLAQETKFPSLFHCHKLPVLKLTIRAGSNWRFCT